MVSESLLVLTFLALSAQNSSFLTSLILIPMSLAVIYNSLSLNFFSSAILFLFVMIFIGGLLVFLVSVASISFQEQTYNMSIFLFLFVLFFISPFLMETKLNMKTEGLMLVSVWFEAQSNLVFGFCLFLLSALLSMSKLVFSFKGLVRIL